VDDSARKLKAAADSGFRKRARVFYGLRLRGGELPLAKPRTTIGRSVQCDVVLDSPLVSRQHAALLVTEQGVSLEDLGSRNGVLVNSTLRRGTFELKVGDRIQIGEDMLEIIERAERPNAAEMRSAMTVSFEAPKPSEAAAKTDGAKLAESEDSPATRRADALNLLGSVVDKALVLGHADEAERLLTGHLSGVLDEAKAGVRPSPSTVTAAGGYAVKLASATGKVAWMNYAIDLYRAIAQPMPLSMVDDLYALLRRIRGVDRALLRQYVSTLRSRAERLSPSERFALQRIEGLERLAAL
jgi:hypothetical protein